MVTDHAGDTFYTSCCEFLVETVQNEWSVDVWNFRYFAVKERKIGGILSKNIMYDEVTMLYDSIMML